MFATDGVYFYFCHLNDIFNRGEHLIWRGLINFVCSRGETRAYASLAEIPERSEAVTEGTLPSHRFHEPVCSLYTTSKFDGKSWTGNVSICHQVS